MSVPRQAEGKATRAVVGANLTSRSTEIQFFSGQ